MVDAVIIEDEPGTRDLLKGLLREYCPDITLKGEADSVETGLELIKKLRPFLVFLDVELGDGSAFDLLMQLSEINFHVIFTTAFDHYALRAIKFSAIDYLLKPINSLDLIAAVEKVRLKQTETIYNNLKMLITNFQGANNPQRKQIALPTFEGLIFVDQADIIRFEAEANYTLVFIHGAAKVMVSKTLKEFEDFVSNDDFVRIHHAHLINLKHLKRYVKGKGGYVIMSDGSKAEVSIRKKEVFLNKIKML